MGRWLEGAGHFWKVSAGSSTLPVGMEIMSFFGGRGGDSFMDMHGSFTGAPSVLGGRGHGSYVHVHVQGHSEDVPVRWLGSLLKGLGGSAGGCLCSVGGLEGGESALSGSSPGFFEGVAWIFGGVESS